MNTCTVNPARLLVVAEIRNMTSVAWNILVVCIEFWFGVMGSDAT